MTDWPKPETPDDNWILLETTTEGSRFGSFMDSGRWLYTQTVCGLGQWSLAETRTQGRYLYTSTQSWRHSDDM